MHMLTSSSQNFTCEELVIAIDPFHIFPTQKE